MIKLSHISRLPACILMLISVTIQAQTEFLVNPSFEGTPGTYIPYSWETCKGDGNPDNTYNDPDFMDYYTDTILQDTLYHKDGNTLCLLRARSDHYGVGGTSNKSGTYEHISSLLVQSFEKDSTYNLIVWLASLTKFKVADGVAPNVGFPLRFQIFEADITCSAAEEDKILDTLITSSDWRLYDFELKAKRNCDYIYIRVYWDDKIVQEQNGRYNGIVLLDMATINDCKTKNLNEETLYFKQNPPLQLSAPPGFTYIWDPRSYLSSASSQSPYMLRWSKSVKLTMIDAFNCLTKKNFEVILNCDTLYPDPIQNTYNAYYKTYEDNILTASEGAAYYWHDSLFLSDILKRNTVITNYRQDYSVTITDQYNCKYNELFNVLLDCNYLYNKPLVEGGYRTTSRELTMAYGESAAVKPVLTDSLNIDNYALSSINWTPTDYLSCTDCYEPLITPREDLTYTIEYRDTFNCLFYETIDINLSFGKIPNVITPGFVKDSDGKNDVFRIPGLPENSAIEIYDKSGRLIFKANPYAYPNWWDGTDMSGKPVRSGNYWYVLYVGGNKNPRKGFVMVVR